MVDQTFLATEDGYLIGAFRAFLLAHHFEFQKLSLSSTPFVILYFNFIDFSK